MYKGIDWLKEEVNKALRDMESDGISYYDYMVLKKSLNELINQLDEPEVLSQEFINEKAVEVYADTEDAEVHVAFRMRDLQNLLVPKQELPVIPNYVAKWIEEIKKQSKSLVFAIAHIYDKNEIGKSPNKEENIIFQWMELTDNEEVFARAWLDGYTVEVEQKYLVNLLDEGIGAYLIYYPKSGNYGVTGILGNSKGITRFTEQEIKDYDERYIPFMVPVDEVNND